MNKCIPCLRCRYSCSSCQMLSCLVVESFLYLCWSMCPVQRFSRLQYLWYSCFLHILLHFGDCNALVSSITERARTETLANICTSCYMSIFRYLAVVNCLLLSQVLIWTLYLFCMNGYILCCGEYINLRCGVNASMTRFHEGATFCCMPFRIFMFCSSFW